MNSFIYYMFTLLVLLMLLCIYQMSIIPKPYSQKEGFTSYFRQSIRPHMRNIRSLHNTITDHVNNKFNSFGKSIGFK